MALRIDAIRKTIRAKDPVRPTTKLAMPQGEERTTMARGHAIEMPRLIHQLNLHSALTSGLTFFVRRAGESIYAMIADLALGLALPEALLDRLRKAVVTRLERVKGIDPS